ncbi:unnamed protein product [Ambrosiozyma monospora]|uniref:Unnamed protein product n=1 Tax=Ambrosiozyma monospora TaxID=43982 RepID=A0ACB5THA5_AMBMO|nr:unnamed protein product [Ambrosiozyma monospora]
MLTKCPILHPGESTATYVPNSHPHRARDPNDDDSNNNNDIPRVGTPSITTENGDILVEEEEDEIEDPKVCPLMIGDARALFKEKLARMTVSSVRDPPKGSPKNSAESNSRANTPDSNNNNSNNNSNNSNNKSNKKSQAAPTCCPGHYQNAATSSNPLTPTSSGGFDDNSRSGNKRVTCPVTGLSAVPPPKRTRRTGKKLKTISPSAIKNLNYNNTKQVISVIEKHLPNRKVVWLLIDRFFDKLYINLPYVDEESFRIKVASIIDSADSSSQKIKLSSIGSQYCEEFLMICLLLIIIRLAWLTLPSKLTNDLTDEEVILMKPENLVTMVLVDMLHYI